VALGAGEAAEEATRCGPPSRTTPYCLRPDPDTVPAIIQESKIM